MRLLSLRTCFGSLWTCALGAGGPLHEVFCMGNACTCTESACIIVIVIGAVSEGVVVLKGEADSLFLHWLCIALCHFHMSPNIWNTLDGQMDALILSPLILLT